MKKLAFGKVSVGVVLAAGRAVTKNLRIPRKFTGEMGFSLQKPAKKRVFVKVSLSMRKAFFTFT